MGRIKTFFKNLRIEYKVVLFFLVLLIFYILYSVLLKDFIDGQPATKNMSENSGSERSGIGTPKSSIEEAVTADRPIVLSADSMKGKIESLSSGNSEIKGIEIATEVANPTIWIYMGNDGTRKDDLAEDYCKWLHSNGVPASSVMILDEAARAKGKIVDIGEKKCM